MTKDEIVRNLEALYVDFYDGLYNDHQLKHMLKKLKLQNPYISLSEWSEMILDAQWKYANEEDYALKRLQLESENHE